MCPLKTRSFNFLPSSKEAYSYLPNPKPAKNYFPEWMKQIPSSLPHPYDDSPKMCPPFMDTFYHGYIQELICDVLVTVNGKDEEGNDIVEFETPLPIPAIGSRREKGEKKNLLPKFPGHYRSEQHWESYWEPQTPKGYSTLYCHPLNRLDLPFTTLAGIIDTDVFSVSGPIPFLIKEGFQGVIPAGTPIYQIIFIKRDNWKSNKKEFDDTFLTKMLFSAKKYLTGGYKKLYWVKKRFD